MERENSPHINYNLVDLSTFFAKCSISDNMNTAKKIKKRICAIPALVAAMPPNPKMPAINAIIKNTVAQYNMFPPSVSDVISF